MRSGTQLLLNVQKKNFLGNMTPHCISSKLDTYATDSKSGVSGEVLETHLSLQRICDCTAHGFCCDLECAEMLELAAASAARFVPPPPKHCSKLITQRLVGVEIGEIQPVGIRSCNLRGGHGRRHSQLTTLYQEVWPRILPKSRVTGRQCNSPPP